jgi:hypothetical protein
MQDIGQMYGKVGEEGRPVAPGILNGAPVLLKIPFRFYKGNNGLVSNSFLRTAP